VSGSGSKGGGIGFSRCRGTWRETDIPSRSGPKAASPAFRASRANRGALRVPTRSEWSASLHVPRQGLLPPPLLPESDHPAQVLRRAGTGSSCSACDRPCVRPFGFREDASSKSAQRRSGRGVSGSGSKGGGIGFSRCRGTWRETDTPLPVRPRGGESGLPGVARETWCPPGPDRSGMVRLTPCPPAGPEGPASSFTSGVGPSRSGPAACGSGQ
jgi:hypothetical protein